MKKLLLLGASIVLLGSNAFAAKRLGFIKAERCTTTTTSTVTDLNYDGFRNECIDKGSNCTKVIVTTNPVAEFRRGETTPFRLTTVVAAEVLTVKGKGVFLGNLSSQVTMTLGVVTFQTANAGSITVNVVNAPFDPVTRILTILLK